MWNIEKLREHAKEITRDCEKRGYTIEETELLPEVLKNEVNQCKRREKEKPFKALAE